MLYTGPRVRWRKKFNFPSKWFALNCQHCSYYRQSRCAHIASCALGERAALQIVTLLSPIDPDVSLRVNAEWTCDPLLGNLVSVARVLWHQSIKFNYTQLLAHVQPTKCLWLLASSPPPTQPKAGDLLLLLRDGDSWKEEKKNPSKDHHILLYVSIKVGESQENKWNVYIHLLAAREAFCYYHHTLNISIQCDKRSQSQRSFTNDFSLSLFKVQCSMLLEFGLKHFFLL